MSSLNTSDCNFRITSDPVRHAMALAVGLVMLSYGTTSNAQLGPDAGALQQQLQREAERNRQQPNVEQLEPKKEPAPATDVQSTEKIQVNGFTVTGLSLISLENAQLALKNFNGKELTFGQIEEAGTAITDLYTKAGRVATAVIPPQEVKDGIIEIKILEGTVEAITLESDSENGPSRFNQEVARGFIKNGNGIGEFVDFHQLQRSFILLNELPGVSAEGGLSAGQKDGGSNIQVKLKDKPLMSGRVDLSNYGAASTGVAQIIGGFNLNDPFGIGDQIALDVIGSEGAIYGSLKYWLPVGYDGWRFGVGGSSLSYTGLESFSATSTNGSASTYGVYATYALERDSSGSQNLNFGLENRDYLNYVKSLEASKYSITSFTMGWSGSKNLGKDNLNYSVNATIGNLVIRNQQQLLSDQSPTGPFTAGTYEKVNVYLGYLSPIPIDMTSVLLSFNGQISGRNLNSSEQIYVGGPYGVRAYPIAQGGGAQGLVASAEIIHTYPSQLQVSTFFDVGLVQQYRTQWSPTLQGLTNADNVYAVYAAGFGAKYNYQNFQLQGTLAFRVGQNPLYNSDGSQLNTDNQYRSVQAWIKGNYFF